MKKLNTLKMIIVLAIVTLLAACGQGSAPAPEVQAQRVEVPIIEASYLATKKQIGVAARKTVLMSDIKHTDGCKVEPQVFREVPNISSYSLTGWQMYVTACEAEVKARKRNASPETAEAKELRKQVRAEVKAEVKRLQAERVAQKKAEKADADHLIAENRKDKARNRADVAGAMARASK